MSTRVIGMGLAGAVAALTFGAAPAIADPGADSAGSGLAAPARADRGDVDGAGKPEWGKWRFDATATAMTDIGHIVGADELWRRGADGSGVGVALVDTGVVPVDGLLGGNIVNGPDLSFDSQAPGLRHLDTYGHGTHLAGIIAGQPGADGFRGMAPGSQLTSVKVGAGTGLVDVSQVIAAIDWVVEHAGDDPQHPIRVLNLAYGTDSVQDPRIDPLAHAVQNAWRAGIVVVVAGGNGGVSAPLTSPATDPYVIAVGAADSAGTVHPTDDTVLDFSSRGTDARRVDLVAPGRSVVSLRDPGSYVDETYPGARVGERYFRGSGTSQAAAVVTGAVALLLQERPSLTPDEVKNVLRATANPMPHADEAGRGAGELDLAGAAHSMRTGSAQTWPASTGTGSLEAARGSAHVGLAGSVLVGEYDLFGAFDSAAWAQASSAGTAWDGGLWMGRELTGAGWETAGTWTDRTWTDRTWTDRTWTGITWSGLTWSGVTWSSLTWSGLTWSGLTWSGVTWSGVTWSGLTWSGLTWSGVTWSGLTWSGVTWSGVTWSGVTWSGLTWSGVTWSGGVWA